MRSRDDQDDGKVSDQEVTNLDVLTDSSHMEGRKRSGLVKRQDWRLLRAQRP